MNIWERKLKKEFITFAEPPTGKDEMKIAELLKKFYAEINSRGSATFTNVFTKEARVESLYLHKVMGVAEYRRGMEKILPLLQFSFLDNTRIQFQKKEVALVSGVLSSQIKDRGLYRGVFSAECKKMNCQWRIEATHHSLPNELKPRNVPVSIYNH